MMSRSTAWVALLVVIMGCGIFTLREERLLQTLDHGFAAWLMANTSPRMTEVPQVTLVDIDQRAIDLAGGWPWSPMEYALFLHSINSMRPSVVVIDHPPTWPQADSRELSTLENWALRTPRLVIAGLPIDEQIRQDAMSSPAEEKTSITLAAPIGRVIGSQSGLPVMNGALMLPSPVLAQGASVAPLLIDRHNAVATNSLALLVVRGESLLPTVVLETARLHLKILSSGITAAPGRELIMNKNSVPLAVDGRLPIDFRMFDRIPRVSFSDLLVKARAGNLSGSFTPLLEDRIVILGRADSAAQLIPTASGRDRSIAELIAASVATLLCGHPPREAPTAGWLMLIGLFGLLALFLGKFSTGGFFRFGLIGICSYFPIASALLYYSDIVMPISLPIALMPLMLFVKVVTSRASSHQGH